jgi:hypothetical protein
MLFFLKPADVSILIVNLLVFAESENQSDLLVVIKLVQIVGLYVLMV